MQKNNQSDIEFKCLDEICDIRNGYAFKKKFFHRGTTKVIRIGDIQSKIKIDEFSGVYSSETPSEKYKTSKNDLLIGLTGHMGKIGRIVDDDIAYINQRIAIIKANEYTNFIYHILKTERFKHYLNANSQKAIQTNISTKQIAQFKIPFPALETQNALVRILDDFENSTNQLIQNITQEIELREQQYHYYRNKLLAFK